MAANKMKLPKSVVLSGRRWKVQTRLAHIDDAGYYGDTCTNSSTITVYTAIHDHYGADPQATFFHELCHAALASTGTSAAIGSEKVEEAVVRALEAALWPVIKAGLLR